MAKQGGTGRDEAAQHGPGQDGARGGMGQGGAGRVGQDGAWQGGTDALDGFADGEWRTPVPPPTPPSPKRGNKSEKKKRSLIIN